MKPLDITNCVLTFIIAAVLVGGGASLLRGEDGALPKPKVPAMPEMPKVNMPFKK
jgi:hypothetical protein